MRRLVIIAAVLWAGGAASPLLAQEKTPPAVTRDTDRDGVPDVRDRCPNTPIGTRVDANGCPAPVQQAPAQAAAQPASNRPTTPTPAAGAPAPGAGTPTVVTQAQPSAANAPSPPRAGAAPAPGTPTPGAAGANAAKPALGPPQQAALPSVTLSVPVTPTVTAPAAKPPSAPAAAPPAAAPTAAQRAAAAAPRGAPTGAAPVVAAPPARPAERAIAAPSVTAGYFMPPFTGRGEAERLEYLRSLAVRLDSAVRGLIGVFAGTAGSAVPASDPSQLSQRVRDRWMHCDEHYLDFVSFGDAVQLIKDSLPNNPLVRRAADGLDNALQEMAAVAECDNIVSMVNRPQTFSPWGSYYDASTRNFYRDWYTQLRAIHEADRTFARQLNGVLPADRALPILTALPSAAPTAGTVVR